MASLNASGERWTEGTGTRPAQKREAAARESPPETVTTGRYPPAARARTAARDGFDCSVPPSLTSTAGLGILTCRSMLSRRVPACLRAWGAVGVGTPSTVGVAGEGSM